jgi:hypothetical protein
MRLYSMFPVCQLFGRDLGRKAELEQHMRFMDLERDHGVAFQPRITTPRRKTRE